LKKVLLLQGDLKHYRQPLFHRIGLQNDLTLGYINKNEIKPSTYKIFKINSFKIFGIYFSGIKFYRFLKKYDTIIIMPDLHYFNYCSIPFLLKNKRIISWSIGMRASYKLPFDIERKKTILDIVFKLILKKCNTNLFYYKWPIQFWDDKNISNKTIVVNNTILVPKTNFLKNKKYKILYIGSLIKGKGIKNVLKSFNKLILNGETFFKLEIIGDGPLKSEITKYIDENNLGNYVEMKGEIVDQELLKNVFKNTICCVSPNQAGLSAIMSFGYGVPFITKKNSITGGERLNIQNDFNGILYKTNNELTNIFLSLKSDYNDFLKYGINAKNTYNKNLNFNYMVETFINTINLG